MRHKISGNKLSRNQSLRMATVRDIAKATLICQRICTTKAKAKEARKVVDRLITLGKKGTLTDKRRAFSILCDHQLVSDLFKKTSPLFKNRIGGYTRIIPLSTRKGDNAQLVYLELTEKEELMAPKPKAVTKKQDKTAKEPKDSTELQKEKKVKKSEAKAEPVKTAKKKEEKVVTAPKEEPQAMDVITPEPVKEEAKTEIPQPEKVKAEETQKIPEDTKEKKKGFSLKDLFGRKKPSGE